MIANAQPTDSAGYDCVVTSSCGTATSDIAYLTVIASCESIDYNGDGFVNPDDLGDFITSYFQAANLCQ
ncbi:MAG: hypothetical protein ACKVS8_00720 [Phycisphaerales bacterium]